MYYLTRTKIEEEHWNCHTNILGKLDELDDLVIMMKKDAANTLTRMTEDISKVNNFALKDFEKRFYVDEDENGDSFDVTVGDKRIIMETNDMNGRKSKMLYEIVEYNS